MRRITLGRTGLNVNANGFGALPVQRVSKDDAVYLLQKAFYNGIDFFDTARGYTDSEEKLGAAFAHIRHRLTIATKTGARTAEGFWKDLETSLTNLRTDYIDIYQFHNPDFVPEPGDESGLYEAMQEAKKQGKIRFISITNHRLPLAEKAVESGLYDTLQFPFSYLASDKDVALVEKCQEKNVGFIAMKALSGGLITNSAAAHAFMAQYDGVLPIWGIQRESELDEFLRWQVEQPAMNGEMQQLIARDREELAGDFCRGCGYCMPCPAGIEINSCARMSLLLRRAPWESFTSPDWQEKMAKIRNCLECGQCSSRCPYSLDTPALLKKNLEDFEQFVREH